jgi:hypothetical protein
MGVRVGKTIAGRVVDVDSGVKVLRGVGVEVAVGGIAACVRVDAAFAVWAMNVLIVFGSRGGTGVTMDGAHAMIRIKIMNQRNNFFPGALIVFHL